MAQRKRTAAESSQVERARKKFEVWRRSRKRSSPIPDKLWKSAVVAAKEVGRKGHGRNGASAYKGAERVWIGLKDLEPGCRCPSCNKA